MDVGPDLSPAARSSWVEAISALVPGSKRGPGEQGDDVVETGRVGATAVVALADGAGSARRGRYGAELAALSAVESICEQLGGDTVEDPLETVLIRAMQESRRTLFLVAGASAGGDEPIEVRDLATTLAIAVCGPEQVGIASVGDGIQVAMRDDGELAFTAMAPDTEIANHADFLTSPAFQEKVEVEIHPAAEIECILLSSDGLDPQLVDRREGERWPQHATVTALMNAPVLGGWGRPEFEVFLASDLIRHHSDDDLSLALIRRVEEPGDKPLRAGRLTLTPSTEVRPGCQTWRVDGCPSLLAIAVDPPLPPDAEVAAREEQVLDRGRRYAPVNWPLRRIEHGLVLIQRLPPKAILVGSAVRRPDEADSEEILVGVRSAVEALHGSGLAHGHLSLDSFALYPDRSVVLWEPGPGMFGGPVQLETKSRDLGFLSRLPDGTDRLTSQDEA
jgi:hypothetical protein